MLAGAYNRRYAFAWVNQLTANLPLAVGKLSVVLVDLGDFKSINDKHGHPAGDHELKEITALMSRVTRNDDTVARIGGEAFLIILPRRDETEA